MDDFRLSQRFNANADTISGWQHYVDACHIASLSENQIKANASPVLAIYDADMGCIATILEILTVSNFKVMGMSPPHKSRGYQAFTRVQF